MRSGIIEILSIICLVITGFSQMYQYRSTTVIQESFNKSFCGDCKYNSTSCINSINYIANLNQTGNWNQNSTPIVNNYKTNYSQIKFINQNLGNINLTFPGKNLTNTSFMPAGDQILNRYALKGVIIYFHPTIFGRYNAPSSNNEYYETIGGLYASQNYAVVMPDLIGFSDSGDPHPYVLYPQQNVKCAILALNHAYSQIRNLNP